MLSAIARLTLLAYLCGGLLIPAIHGVGKDCEDAGCNRLADHTQLASACQHVGLEHSAFAHQDGSDGDEACSEPSIPTCPGDDCPSDCVVCFHIQWHSGDLSWLVIHQADEATADCLPPSNSLRHEKERLASAKPRGPPISVTL